VWHFNTCIQYLSNRPGYLAYISLQIHIISLCWDYSKSSLLAILKYLIVVEYSHPTVLKKLTAIPSVQLHPIPITSLLHHSFSHVLSIPGYRNHPYTLFEVNLWLPCMPAYVVFTFCAQLILLNISSGSIYVIETDKISFFLMTIQYSIIYIYIYMSHFLQLVIY
jgi:hypothetical protein